MQQFPESLGRPEIHEIEKHADLLDPDPERRCYTPHLKRYHPSMVTAFCRTYPEDLGPYISLCLNDAFHPTRKPAKQRRGAPERNIRGMRNS